MLQIYYLYNKLESVESKIEEWENNDIYPGDQGYQQLLMQRDDLIEEIRLLEDETE